MASDYCTGDMLRASPDCGQAVVSIRAIGKQPIKQPKIKEIKITQLDHGYVLTVGCKQIALDTPAKIIFGLKLYLNNPEKVENAFLNGEFKFEK